MSEQPEVGTQVTRREQETATSPTRMVELAIEKGMGVEVIERLVALQERVSDRNARSAYIYALTAAQEEIPEIPKNKTARIRTKSGSTYSYSYATLDQIARIIRPVLARHGLSYAWDSEVSQAGVKVICTLRHVDGHSESATFAAPTDTEASMSGSQKHAAVLTYGRRQGLMQVLGLAILDEDTDASAATEPRISEGQVADLRALIEEVGADHGKLLHWLGVSSIESLPMSDYSRAVSALERKRGGS